MAFGVHPLILIAALATAAAVAVIAIAVRTRKALVRAGLGVLAAILLIPGAYVFEAFHPEWFDGRYSAYKSFYQALELGMSHEQVFATMRRHYPTGGARRSPEVFEDTEDSLGFFMNPEGRGEPNCEGIILAIENGYVTRKDYSPD